MHSINLFFTKSPKIALVFFLILMKCTSVNEIDVSFPTIKKTIPLEQGNCWTYLYKIDSFNNQTDSHSIAPIRIIKTGKIKFSLESIDTQGDRQGISLNCHDSGLALKISYLYFGTTVARPVDSTDTSYENNFRKNYGVIDGTFKSYNSNYFFIDSILSYCPLSDSNYQDDDGHYKRYTSSKNITLNNITDNVYIRTINYLKLIQVGLMSYHTDFYSDSIAWFKNIGILFRYTNVNNFSSNRDGGYGISLTTQCNLLFFNETPIDSNLSLY